MAMPKTFNAPYDSTRVVCGNSTNATVVKNAPGKVYGYIVNNTNAAARYLKLYDKATAPTIGTDTPKMTIMVPSGRTETYFARDGIEFTAGISFGTTTGLVDSDNGALTANETVVHILYK